VVFGGASTGVGARRTGPRIAEQLVATARASCTSSTSTARAPPAGTSSGRAIAPDGDPAPARGGVDTRWDPAAFAAGATRIVTSMAVVDDPPQLAARSRSPVVAGVGLDPGPSGWPRFPGSGTARLAPPTLAGVVGELADAA
jgi:hypothetical protein